MDNRKLYNDFLEFRKQLDEALYRDKGLKIDFYLEINHDFVVDDFEELKKSIDSMINVLRDIRKEL